MLREVLLALQGLSGDFLIVGEGKKRGGVWAPVADSFHPSELVLLARLCAVGSAYRAVTDFVDRSCSLKAGMYTRALGAALDKQLDRYRQLLVSLEEEMKVGAYPPSLTYISNVVTEVRLVRLFP